MKYKQTGHNPAFPMEALGWKAEFPSPDVPGWIKDNFMIDSVTSGGMMVSKNNLSGGKGYSLNLVGGSHLNVPADGYVMMGDGKFFSLGQHQMELIYERKK